MRTPRNLVKLILVRRHKDKILRHREILMTVTGTFCTKYQVPLFFHLSLSHIAGEGGGRFQEKISYTSPSVLEWTSPTLSLEYSNVCVRDGK